MIIRPKCLERHSRGEDYCVAADMELDIEVLDSNMELDIGVLDSKALQQLQVSVRP